MASTQTIAVLDASELSDGQMKEVEFGQDGKILLSRLGDKIHATSAFCTHYGAPLAKGVLTSDGRVVCPWHGACFNVCNGDIEDAPAPMALHSFSASVNQDGKIVVTADPMLAKKENKSRPPRLLASGTETQENPVIVVGGGSGGFHTVESLREHGFKGPITIITSEPYAPIDRTKLSKALVTDPAKLEWRSAADLRIKYGINLRTGVEVTSVDLKNKTVALDGGKETAKYGTLVLASGSTANRIPLDGVDLKNIFTLRNIDDAKGIDAECKEGKKLVIIGSSFIGMELAVATAERKMAARHVVSMDKVPFIANLGEQIGRGLQKFHEGKGVTFHLDAKVEKFLPSSKDSSAVGAVVVDGKEIPADVVVLGVGVKPATKFLEGSGIEVQKDGGVEVDEYLKVKGVEDVYAIGDIAVFPQVMGGPPKRIEHWNVAGNHGRAVGKTISGSPQPFVKVPVFWSAQGQQLRYVGQAASADEVIVDGDADAMKFVGYHIKDGKVIAVSSMQRDPLAMKASELFRLGLFPSVEEIRAGKDIMSIDISSEKAGKAGTV